MKYYTTHRISENMHETPEGFLVCSSVSIAGLGELTYGEGETPLEADEEGKVLITRKEKELFRPETMASFEGKPVTISHPSEFVSPMNWSGLAKGVLQNVRRGEGDQKDDIVADLLITDSIAIGLVKNGLREVSCGYEAEYIQLEEGKGMQRKIIGNHLALVDQGRAGPSYAINDHKGKGSKMKLGDKIKAIFAKAQDEAMKVAEDEAGKEEPKKEEQSKDAGAYDELCQMVKDLTAKIESMGKPVDEKKEEPKKEEPKEEKKEESKDDESSGLEDRLKALEVAVAKLLEGESEESESEDADEEESEDDDFEESTMTGDTASRAEILAPGIKRTKDVKAAALKVCYDTKEGKKVIDALTGGKAPTYDSAEKVDTLFIAASELLKQARSGELSKTKQTRDSDSDVSSAMMTAEKMNEINAKHYKR